MEDSIKMDTSTEKRGRGRPRKTEEDSAQAKEKTKKLAKEIRVALGESGKLMPITELLPELKKFGFGDCESLWRRYEAGSNAMRPERMFDLASFAYSKGARGEAVKEALLTDWHYQQKTVSVKNIELKEAALAGMTESLKNYLMVVDPFRMFMSNTERGEEAIKKFNQMIDLAKKLAWDEYWESRFDPVSEERQEDALSYYYVKNDGEIEEFEDDNFLVKASSHLTVSVPKPAWAKNK